jgi:hypothetical protein
MSIRRSILAAALAAALPAATAAAQDTPVGVRPYRFTVEGFLAQSYINEDALVGNGKNSFGGYGARVMFNRSTPAAALRSFAERASVGAYVGTSSGQGVRDVATLQYGVQADVAFFPAPIFRATLDPFFSLGVGGYRTTFAPASGAGDVENTNLAVTPALGTRIPLFGGIGFRGDLRAPIIFGDKTTVTGAAEGGIYLSF